MGVLEILSADHVSVANEAEGVVRSKSEALRRIAELLVRGMVPPTPASEIERVLVEREKLQSTGVGGGVAIPHGALEGLDRHVGAVLLCPHPIDFDAMRAWKLPHLLTAAERFLADPGHPWRPDHDRFVASAGWLADACHFFALQDALQGLPWWDWDAPLRRREPAAVAASAAARASASAARRAASLVQGTPPSTAKSALKAPGPWRKRR